MTTFLGALAFAVYVVASVAAVVALGRENTRRRPQSFDAALDDPVGRLIRHSGD
jgi:hypothetical protein